MKPIYQKLKSRNVLKAAVLFLPLLLISLISIAHPETENDATCTGKVTSIYFNELNGGADIPISNGANFTVSQLGSAYNLEASTTGTIGSIKFTQTGASSHTNIENSFPYNSPGGSSAWVAAAGTYTINMKTYNASDAGGTQCHDTTITFTVSAYDCNCPGTNLVQNPSFENGTTSWTSYGGDFYTNTYVPVCGAKHAEFKYTASSGTGGFYQEFTNISVGTALTLKAYAGVHNNSYNAYIGIYFFNSSGTLISSALSSQVDNILPSMLQKTVTATVPAGTVKVWVGGSTTGDFLKADQFCLTSVPPTGCNPDDHTAANGTKFCAPTPVCAVNNFSWSQPITSSNGSASVRLISSSNLTYLIPTNTYPAAFGSTVTVNVTDVVSYDGYSGRNNVTQLNERWRIVFKKNNVTVGSTPYTTDVPDNVTQGYWRGSLGSAITITGGFDQIVLEHFDVANGSNGPGSVVPASICISYTTTPVIPCTVGGVNLGSLTNYLFAFTNGSTDANWQSASKGFIGNVAVDGIQASERTSGSFAYAGNIITNAATQGAWQSIIDNNAGQASSSTNQSSTISGLKTDLENVFTQINGLTATSGYTNRLSTSLDGLNTQNGIAETFVINITSGFSVSSQINITGDAGDIFILRWDTDQNFTNGYQGQVKFQSGGAIVPLGALKPSNFVHVAGDINASGGGSNPAAPFPQGPRTNNGTGSLISGGSDFSGGGFFTGYWFTTGDPTISGSGQPYGETASLSNAIFVGGWYSKTTKFSMTSGTSGVYVAPVCNVVTGSIGDRVWYDANGNGIQDASETTGIAGVTVQLLNTSNVVLATTTTGGNGEYSFTGLAAGTYRVKFPVSVNGSVVTGQFKGGDITKDSDPSQTTGITNNIVLTSGANITTIDAGYCPTFLVIGDFVWYDVNNNGVQDSGEPGISGATVSLYADADGNNVPDAAAIATTTTSGTGIYKFNNLAPGNYIVGVTLPAGYAQGTTTATSANPNNDNLTDNNGVTLASGEVRSNFITITGGGEPTNDGDNSDGNLTLDFALKGTAAIGDRVWNDLNANGIQDAGEPGLAGVTVVLKNAAGTTVGTTTSSSTGAYSFTNLAPGTYSVTFTTPANFQASPAKVTTGGGNNTNDSDPIGGVAAGIVLTAGQTNNDVDAGFYFNSCIGEASTFGLLGLQNGTFTINSATTLIANVGYSSGVTSNTNQKVTTFTGTAFVHSAVSSFQYTAATYNPSGGIIQNNAAADAKLNSANASAISGSANWGSLSADIVFGNVTTNQVINRVSNITVVQMSSLNYNSNTIQFVGSAGQDDAFIINVAGSFDFSQSTVILTNVRPERIVWNFVNASDIVVNKENTIFKGTILAPIGSVIYHNPASFEGAIIAKNIAVHSDFNLTQKSLSIPCTNTNKVNLGNFVWYDSNNNGTQDLNEPGISGATVKIYADADGNNVPDGAAVATTTSDVNGIYSFTGLTPGNYIVGVTLPAGYAQGTTTATSASPNNDNISDNNGVTLSGSEVRSNFITLSANGEPTNDGDGNNGNLTLDFGLKGTGAIGDRVWNDLNANGVQDSGEPGLAGVTVTLKDANGNTVGTPIVTPASGAYNFTNLAPGTYSVTFSAPAQYIASPAKVTIAGANNTNDSDPIGGVAAGIVITPGLTNNDVDAGFYICSVASGITGPATICANEGALFIATAAGTGATYAWTFTNGVPATATGSSATSSWTTPGEYAVKLVVTKNGCSSTYNTTIIITQAVFANAGPDTDICQGGTTAIPGTGPVGGNYTWTVVSGDPTSIKNGANQSTVTVAPLFTTVYRLTVTQNGCTRSDDVTVMVNVNKNPTANAGGPREACTGKALVIGGNPTGTPPVADPTAPLGYIWSPSTGLNDVTLANPTLTLTTPGVYTYRVIVFNLNTGCSDTATTSITVTNGILSLGNHVWYDANNNGIKESTEKGIATATVKLYLDANNDNVADGAAIATTTTTSTGSYQFTGLCPNNYIVGVTIPSGYAVVTTNGGDPDNDVDNDNNGVNTSVAGEVRSLAITLANNTEPDVAADGDDRNGNNTLDFALKGTGKIGDFVWNDRNGDGIQDAGEPGIPGVTITLRDNLGNIVATTTSGTNGEYSFPNLPPNTYSVTFGTPADYVASPAGQGGNPAKDSDPIAGIVSNIVITAGLTNNDIDAGFVFTKLKLGDFVWYDLNNDGFQDTDEWGIPSVTVKLYADANKDNIADGPFIQSTTTNGLGLYSFTNMMPGNYIVGVTIPSNYSPSFTTASSTNPNNDNNSDNNGVSIVGAEVRSNFITLSTGQEPATAVDGDDTNGNLTLDFGFRGSIKLGDFVFNDHNHNGIQDVGDEGIVGAQIKLNFPSGNSKTIPTTTNGFYEFKNLVPGTYSVTFTTPAGFAPSPSGQGGDPAKDSDPINGVVSNIVLTVDNPNIDAGFFKTITLAGNVWHDANALADNFVNQTSTFQIPSGLRVYLVDNTTGLTVARANVTTAGTYSFTNVTSNTSYKVVLTTILVPIGTVPPGVILPTGWNNTGEKVGNSLGILPGSDGLPDGRINVNTQETDVININFGIRIKNGDIVIG